MSELRLREEINKVIYNAIKYRNGEYVYPGNEGEEENDLTDDFVVEQQIAILSAIRQYLEEKMPKELGDDYLNDANTVGYNMGEVIQYQYGHNDCLEQIRTIIQGIK